MAGVNLNLVSKYRNEIYGLAALFVMLNHACGFYWIRLKTFSNFGKAIICIGQLSYIAVDVFLVLSGISLFFAYQKKQEFSIFMINRFKRIIPSMFLFIFPIALFDLLFYDYGIVNFFYRISTTQLWVDGSRWFPWFASAIILYYLLFPYIYMFIYQNKRNSHINFILLLVATLLVCFLIHRFNPTQYSNIGVAISRLPSFIFGIYAGQFVYKKQKLAPLTWLIVIGAFVFYFYIYLFIDDESWKWYYRYTLTLGAIALTLVPAYIFGLTALSEKTSWINTVFKRLGAVSFEIYLAHAMVYRLLPHAYSEYKPDRWFWTPIWALSMVLAIVIALYTPRIIAYAKRIIGKLNISKIIAKQ